MGQALGRAAGRKVVEQAPAFPPRPQVPTAAAGAAAQAATNEVLQGAKIESNLGQAPEIRKHAASAGLHRVLSKETVAPAAEEASGRMTTNHFVQALILNAKEPGKHSAGDRCGIRTSVGTQREVVLRTQRCCVQ